MSNNVRYHRVPNYRPQDEIDSINALFNKLNQDYHPEGMPVSCDGCPANLGDKCSATQQRLPQFRFCNATKEQWNGFLHRPTKEG